MFRLLICWVLITNSHVQGCADLSNFGLCCYVNSESVCVCVHSYQRRKC